MRRYLTVLAGLLAFTMTACTERRSVDEDTAAIKRIGYYEDFQDSRVVAFEFAEGTSADEIREHAEGLTYTSERLLAAYYFKEGSRTIDSKTLRWSRTIMQANDLLYDTPEIDGWHFAFMRNFLNETRFADCTQSPEDALCRKEK